MEEYAFKKQAHKSSKGGGKYLEGVQPHAADGAAVMWKGVSSQLRSVLPAPQNLGALERMALALRIYYL